MARPPVASEPGPHPTRSAGLPARAILSVRQTCPLTLSVFLLAWAALMTVVLLPSGTLSTPPASGGR